MLEELLALTADSRIIVVEGPNGSGKSTLLGSLQQHLFFQGVPFGVYSQHDSVFEKLSGFELFAIIGNSCAQESAVELGLPIPKLHSKLSQLSSGERAKVLISMALEYGNFTVLDEPFSHLDLKSRAALESMLLKSQKQVVIANHEAGILANSARLILTTSFE